MEPPWLCLSSGRQRAFMVDGMWVRLKFLSLWKQKESHQEALFQSNKATIIWEIYESLISSTKAGMLLQIKYSQLRINSAILWGICYFLQDKHCSTGYQVKRNDRDCSQEKESAWLVIRGTHELSDPLNKITVWLIDMFMKLISSQHTLFDVDCQAVE